MNPFCSHSFIFYFHVFPVGYVISTSMVHLSFASTSLHRSGIPVDDVPWISASWLLGDPFEINKDNGRGFQLMQEYFSYFVLELGHTYVFPVVNSVAAALGHGKHLAH